MSAAPAAFTRIDAANPILRPGDGRFECPILGAVPWEDLGIFNPAACVRDGRVYLVYRAASSAGFAAGVSRLGLAWSDDGSHFERHPAPILYPERGAWQALEYGTGIQDPRLVEDENGTYYLNYALYDRHNCYMATATSRDLFTWHKRGLAFDGAYRDCWSKAGAVVTQRVGERFVAARIRGRYWMYWGEHDIFAATSDDLIGWQPVEIEVGAHKRLHYDDGAWREDWQRGTLALRALITPRAGRHDSALVEPGPQAILTDEGIVLYYNGANRGDGQGDATLPPGAYSVGRAVFDPHDPTAIIARTRLPLLAPEHAYEIAGDVPNVCFASGLVHFRGRWLLYYGAGDRTTAVAAGA